MARPTGFDGRSLESLVVATGLRLFFLGASLGLGAQLLFLDDASDLALRNVLDPLTRALLLGVAVTLGSVAAMSGMAYYLASREKAALVHLNRVTRLASPLLLSAAVPNLFDWRVYENRAFLFCVVATLFALAAERCFRTSLQAARELRVSAVLARQLSRVRARAAFAAPPTSAGGRALALLRRHAALLCLALLVVSFGVTMSVHAVQQHYQLKTYSWDLGIFDNMMYNLLRGHWFKASPVLGAEGSHIQYHATFGAYLFLPIYALWQRPETLIVIQAAFVAAGAIPLYAIAKLRLGGNWLPLLFVYVYLVHAPLHSPLFYDFHFLTFSPAFVFTVIYLYERGKTWSLVVAWLIAISLREEVSATLGTCALYYLLIGRRPRWALFGGCASAIYFVVVKFVIMPAHGQAGESFAWIFQGLIAPGDTGFAGVLRTLLTSPVFAFSQVFTAQKFEYLLRTLGPVLLLPVRRQLVWIMCLPAFIFTLLSTGYQPMIEAHFQYTSNWTPYVILGSIFCLEGWRRSHHEWIRFAAALPALWVSATLFSYNFGAIFQHHTFVGGFHQVEFTLTPAHRQTYRELMNLVRQIPPTASVAACELLVPHVSTRENAYTLNRTGAGGADYLLCEVDWLGRPPVKGFMTTALDSKAYSFVGRSGAFAMWRKGGDHARDAEGLQLLGRAARTPPVPIAPSTGPAAPPATTDQQPAQKNSTRGSAGAAPPPARSVAPPTPPGSSRAPIQALPGMDAMPNP
ncbi:MAG TPA: DUF2079 domain-containing protein [Polyangiaceae bacterium]